MAGAAGPEAAEVVRHVDHERGAEFVASACIAAMSGVSLFIENRLSVTSMMPPCASLARIACKPLPAMLDVEVAEQHDVLGRRLRAGLQAGVRQRIHHHIVVRADEALDDAEARRPSRSE